MIAVALLLPRAFAQDHAFPTSADDRQHYYPTAYKDHGGVDWNCGTITYGGHQGSDFGAGSFAGMDDGRDVTASAGGTVVTAHDGEFDRCTTGNCAGGYGFGNYVKIEHPNGQRTIYGHLKQWSVQVAVGDAVVCGQKLGEMGSSGYSTGPHVHFEVRNASEVAEDPFDGPCSAPPTYWTDQGVYGDIPGGGCDDPEPCQPEATLGCGDTVSARNDGAGSAAVSWSYGCSEFVYSGPERSYELVVGADQPVTVTLTGLSADLDLMALTDAACDGTGCVATSSNPYAGDEQLTLDVAGGVPTVLVVDGWEGAVSDYTLTIRCSAPADTGADDTATDTTSDPTPTTDDTDDGDTDPSDTDPSDTDPGDTDPGTPSPDASGGAAPATAASGCGCAHDAAMGPSFGTSFGMFLSAFAGFSAVRRRGQR